MPRRWSRPCLRVMSDVSIYVITYLSVHQVINSARAIIVPMQAEVVVSRVGLRLPCCLSVHQDMIPTMLKDSVRRLSQTTLLPVRPSRDQQRPHHRAEAGRILSDVDLRLPRYLPLHQVISTDVDLRLPGYLSVHQVINNAQEIIVPKLKGFWHRFKVRLVKSVSRTRWEEDYELIENEGLFQEYLEMGMCLKH